MATPASAQPLITGGVVNVTVFDVVDGGVLNENEILSRNNVGIGVAANVASQVCGVTAQVGVISRQVARTGELECRNTATGAMAVIEQAQ